MADARQIVRWSLERTCPFRNGTDWFLPSETYKQLADLRILATSHTEHRVVDGICVTGWRIGKDNSGKCHEIPSSGFRIEDQIGRFGGIEEVNTTCGECEANVESKLGTRIAGCFGYLDIWPDAPKLDEQLWKIIEERSLEDRLGSAFPVTTPLWYGFWIESPLWRMQAELLYEILDAACDYDDPQDHRVVHFLNALHAAINWELPLHVSLAPLGHTDFGWYTVFPHCPRCKANAPVGRWQEQFPNEPYKRKVCDTIFNPNEHRSSEQDDYDWDASSLEKQLGDSGFEAFTKRFPTAPRMYGAAGRGGRRQRKIRAIIEAGRQGPQTTKHNAQQTAKQLPHRRAGR